MSAVEGADTTAALRARLDGSFCPDLNYGCPTSDLADALRAVLDLADAWKGDPDAGVISPTDILSAIAEHIGVTP